MEYGAQRQMRRGYSLKELFAVMTIAALGLGVLLPALETGSQPTSRANLCRSNMRNLALATMQYEKFHQRYPGYANTVNGNDRGWTFMVLPYLERNDIYEYHSQAGTGQPAQYLEIVLCPSDTRPRPPGAPPTSFVVNAGLPDVPPRRATDPPADWAANGVFHDLTKRFVPEWGTDGELPVTTVSQRYISDGDGTAHTLMLTENVDAQSWVLIGNGDWERQMGFLWDATVSGNPPSLAPPAAMRINNQTGGDPNGRSRFFARPSSFHPGLVNMAFCDGHTRTISQDIDYLVYCLMMTPRGSAAQHPGNVPRNAADPNDPAFVPTIFRTTKFDARALD